METWKSVAGFANYSVSDRGRVRRDTHGTSTHPGKILKPGVAGRGYSFVVLRRDGKSHGCLVHRLVLLTFIGPPADGQETRHLDGVRNNNVLSNLAWGSKAENTNDKHVHGVMAKGERSGHNILTEENVREIRSSKETGRSLAKRFGVHFATISSVRNNINWKHVKAQPSGVTRNLSRAR
jgi:hypothetical protein